jgi:hypothetical protein
MSNMMKDFLYVIMTPPPNPKSAGITYLNNLGNYLRSLGKKVANIYHIEPQGSLYLWSSVTIPSTNHWKEPWQGAWIPWSQGIFRRTFGETPFILIHGENKHYKWFEGLNVVRYYLAGINDLQKKGVPRDGEFKLAWDSMYCDNPDFLLQKPMFRGDLNSLLRHDLKGRNLDLTYVGKAWIHNPNTPRLRDTLELKRDWPESDEEYLFLLSKTRLLFTYDSITSVVSDAILMGAFPVFLDSAKRNDLKWYKSISEQLSGCFCFFGDSYEEYLINFPSNREKYILSTISNDGQYILSLKKFCDVVETFFAKT